MMTFAGIITIFISLCLFGGIMLVSATVNHGTEKWKNGVELEIFMNVGASSRQVDDMREALDADKAQIKGYKYFDHEMAYEEFKKSFSEQPALVESTTPDALPESFRVVPQRAELTEVI